MKKGGGHAKCSMCDMAVMDPATQVTKVGGVCVECWPQYLWRQDRDAVPCTGNGCMVELDRRACSMAMADLNRKQAIRAGQAPARMPPKQSAAPLAAPVLGQAQTRVTTEATYTSVFAAPAPVQAPAYSPLMVVAMTPNPSTAPTPWDLPPGTWLAPSTSATSSQQDSSNGMVSMMQQSTT